VQADVHALYKSGEGRVGTDEQGLIDILAGSSAAYLEQLRAAYAQAHGRSLLVAIKKEVGGGLLAGLGALGGWLAEDMRGHCRTAAAPMVASAAALAASAGVARP
jgi:hypothetical protein